MQSWISDFVRGVQSHPPSRPIIASAPFVCTPLHGPVQFAVKGMLGLSGTRFPQNCPFPFGYCHPHVTHYTKPTHHPKRHLDRFSRFSVGPKCYAAMHCQWGRNPQNWPLIFPWDIVTLPQEDRATAIGNICTKIVRVVVVTLFRRFPRGHTHTYSSQYFAKK